jgi:Zn2+/Cd2+-exporting ATPase
MVKNFHLKNLDCANCSLKIETHLQAIPGVRFASINFPALTLSIDADEAVEINQEIKRIEPDVEISPSLEIKGKADDNEKYVNMSAEISIIAIASFLTLGGFLVHKYYSNTGYHFIEYIVITLAYVLSGWRVLKNALRTVLFKRIFDENILMTVATLGAFAIHKLPEAASVMVLFKIGDFLQRLALNRSRASINSLLAMRPAFARVLSNKTSARMPPERVLVDQIILVRPGERVPLDGIVIDGHAQTDTSAVTGESLPRPVGPGEQVLAGTINLSGNLSIKVTKEFSQSSLSKIMELTSGALSKKARTEQFITRFARYYTPLVVFSAALVAVLPVAIDPSALFSDWFHRALVLLVISCPCAFVISIPLGYVGGIVAASKNGILVKTSNIFDDLSALNTVVFDKTGTLTRGVFTVASVVPSNGYSAATLLRFAAEAQCHSLHPIAQSIVKYYGGHIEVSCVKDFQEIAGFGILATCGGHRVISGNDRLMHRENVPHSVCSHDSTVVHVAIGGLYAGYITMGDELKTDADDAILALRTCGIDAIHMVTGDNISAANAIASELEIDGVHAGLLPQGKLEVVEGLLANVKAGKKLAFVGDGINDAPVIARADVGIAMGSGADAAIETADMVIMSGSPLKVARAIQIARKTKAIVWQNIIASFAIKGFFIALGIIGIATMWEAIFADMGVALWAIYNATRIMKA